MKYAIVESGGKQFKAVEGGTLEVDRLPVEPGSEVKLDQVLLLADEGTITVGTPVIKDFPIWTKVVEHFKGDKVVIFNYSPKKRIRVKTGHRQNYTRLKVEQIGGAELLVKEPEPKAKKVEKVVEPKEKKPVAKKAEPKTAAKPTARKAAVKPAAEKVVKPAKAAVKTTKTSEKAAKTGTKKPATSVKKSTEKK